MFEVKPNNIISINSIYILMGFSFMLLISYLLLGERFIEAFSLSYAPPGQTLYVLSKTTALFVYVLMWWQIMLGMFKKINKKQHVILGASLFVLIFIHVALFVTAVSIRQGELHLSVLVPVFSEGYYSDALAIGVIAFFMIIAATLAAVLRKQFSKSWKWVHALVYFSFLLATVHSLMIGSEVNSGLFSYIVYGAVLSLVVAFIYKTCRTV